MPITLFGRSENPAIPLSADFDTPVDLTRQSLSIAEQLGYAPIWRGVNLISRDIAKLPLRVYRRIDGDARELERTHPGYRVAARQPNAEMSAYKFWETLVSHALVHGNGYALINRRRGDLAPLALEILDPRATNPVRKPGNVLHYETTTDTATRTYPDRDVLNVRGLSADGVLGIGILTIARETISLGVAGRRYGAAFFGGNGRPSVALEHPGHLSENAERNLRQSWLRNTAGIRNAHGVAILQEGLKLNTYNVTAQEAQVIELRKFEIVEVANLLGVPPHKLGDDTRTSHSSLEQENQSYLDESLDPWAREIESECNRKLLDPAQFDADSHFFEFNRAALVRANLTDRYTAYQMAFRNGIMSRDEIRARENLNPIPDGSGSDFLVPADMVPQAEPAETDPEPEPTDETDTGRARRAVLGSYLRYIMPGFRRKARAGNPTGFVDKMNHHRETFDSMIGTLYTSDTMRSRLWDGVRLAFEVARDRVDAGEAVDLVADDLLRDAPRELVI